MPEQLDSVHLHQATERFNRAHFQGILQDWRANLSGRNTDLFNYEEVRNTLGAREGATLPQLQNVPLEKVVGSVGRYRDFNQAFLPRNEALRERWKRVDAAMNSLEGVPAVELYQVGELYFVRDGNHRVSVARSRGDKTIEAAVTCVDAPFPVEAGNAEGLSEWLTEAGHRLFLQRTRLLDHFPDVDIRLTEPGRYNQIDEQIAVHRWYLGVTRWAEVSEEEAVISWYETVYQPLAEEIRESGILKEFPKRTVADLYLWICHHREELKEQYNLDLSDKAAVSTFASVYSDKPLKKALKGVRLAAARAAAGESVLVGMPREADEDGEVVAPTP